MFKELYEIIFIILLMQALQFQLLPPACGVSVMCSRGKDWWVHSPKIPVQSFKWASQTFYLNLQRFKWVRSHSGKKGFFLRICDETEEGFSGYKKAIIQLKYKTTQHWPKHDFFPERTRGGGADCFSLSCLLFIGFPRQTFITLSTCRFFSVSY